ncbi:QRFP-like peptide receptor [Oculina patagonica]
MFESPAIAITTVLSILAIGGIVGNILVCAIIIRNRDMRIPINYLLLNLAVADIMYVTFIAPNVFFVQFSFTSHPNGIIGTVLCKTLITGTVAWIGGASSIATLPVVAIERYYAVVYPLGNKGKLSERKLKVIILAVWIFSLILNIPPFLVWNFDRESNLCVYKWPEKWMGKAYNLTWSALAFFPLVLMLALYSRVVYTLWIKRNDDCTLSEQQKGVMRVRKRVTLMVVAVSVIFGICWGTSSVVYTLRSFAPHDVGPVPIAITNTMVLFNSAVNPFVYALLNQQFREKMKKTICCTASLSARVHPAPQTREPANNTTHSPHTAGPCSQE